ncbi:MAG: hypothetical protein R6V86_08300 [Spirochaetia bacterium]
MAKYYGSEGGFNSSWTWDGETGVNFSTKTYGNPTNSTSATQGISLEVEADPEARVRLRINGQEQHIALQQLLQRAFVGYTGGFDSPAFKLHRAPREEEYIWSASVEDTDQSPAYYYLRGRQQNGSWVWSSPVRTG